MPRAPVPQSNGKGLKPAVSVCCFDMYIILKLTDLPACRRRRIKCGEERPTCNNCVKSKRNCEGYTPRVIFKDPLGARPTGGTFRDTGSQFPPTTSYNGLEAHHRPLQPRNAGQIPLPVIAPNPTQQEHQIWTGMKSYGMMPAYPDRPYDTSTYTPSDLPPHVLQKIAQRNCSLDTSPVTPKTDTFIVHQTGFSSQHQPGHHADRDSGIDVSCPEFRSEWSHSSTSSTTMPIKFHQTPSNHELSTNQAQHRDPTDALSEAPFQSSAVALQQEPWSISKSEYGSDQYLPSQLSNAVQDCYEPNEALPTVNYGSSYDQAALQGYGHLHGKDPLECGTT